MTKQTARVKEHLAANPLFFKDGACVPTCLRCCGGEKPKGAKKLALYKVTNYSNIGWNKCSECQEKY